MRYLIVSFIGLMLSVSVGADPVVKGQVRLSAGQPAVGVQVRLFDWADLQQFIGTTTDESGRFALPLRAGNGTALPAGFALGPNYPNPFNPATIIPYQLPVAGHVRLDVFNMLGQRLATLVDAERSAGAHTARWDGTDAGGRAMGAGVYVYRLRNGGLVMSRRMVLVDGQAGVPTAEGIPEAAWSAETELEAADRAVYGLAVFGAGLVPHVNPAFRVGTDEADIVLDDPSSMPRLKRTESRVLGDVNNDGRVDFFDALYVLLYSVDPSIVLPNGGDITLGDVNGDGQVNAADALILVRYIEEPSDSGWPPGLGPVAPDVAAPVIPEVAMSKMYWTESGTGWGKIRRANLDGSEIEDLITGLAEPRGLGLDLAGGKIYWTERDSSRIRRANLDGSEIEDLVTKFTRIKEPYGLALDVAGGKMYWTDYDTGKIQRTNLDGSEIEDLVSANRPGSLALDMVGGKMYWASNILSNGGARIGRANLDGSEEEGRLVIGLNKPFGLALDMARGKIYWTESGRAKIQRSNLDSSEEEDLVIFLGNPFGLALDVAREKMYWTDTGTNKIQRSNLDGTRIEDLVTGLDTPRFILLSP